MRLILKNVILVAEVLVGNNLYYCVICFPQSNYCSQVVKMYFVVELNILYCMRIVFALGTV